MRVSSTSGLSRIVQPVGLDPLVIPLFGVNGGSGLQPLGKLRQWRVEPGAPAHIVDGFEAAGRHEPPRIGVDIIPLSLLVRP